MEDFRGIVAYRKRTSEAANVLLGLVALCIGVFLVLNGARWTGMLTLVTGGAVALFSFVTLLDRKPVIVVSESGLWLRSHAQGTIPWRGITSVKIKAMPRSGTFITIELNEQHEFDFEVSGLDQPATLIYRIICEHAVSACSQ